MSWLVFGVALAGALMMYRSLWADPSGTTLGSVGHTNDPMQMMWFLEWTPWQLLHGHDPFTTDALFYPGGCHWRGTRWPRRWASWPPRSP